VDEIPISVSLMPTDARRTDTRVPQRLAIIIERVYIPDYAAQICAIVYLLGVVSGTVHVAEDLAIRARPPERRTR
jgi:hypothetical protein